MANGCSRWTDGQGCLVLFHQGHPSVYGRCRQSGPGSEASQDAQREPGKPGYERRASVEYVCTYRAVREYTHTHTHLLDQLQCWQYYLLASTSATRAAFGKTYVGMAHRRMGVCGGPLRRFGRIPSFSPSPLPPRITSPHLQRAASRIAGQVFP